PGRPSAPLMCEQRPRGPEMIMQDSPTAAPTTPRNRIGAWLLIAGVVVATAGAFAYVGGWLTPDRLTPGRLVDQLQDNAGTFAGFRRNHAKGVCVSGWFDSNGAAQAYSVAQLRARAYAGGRPLRDPRRQPVCRGQQRADSQHGIALHAGKRAAVAHRHEQHAGVRGGYAG